MKAQTLLLALLLVAAFASAHGAPPPSDESKRLLHDYNDDCGGDGVSINCRGTHDLIALDVQEAWGGGYKLHFIFFLDEGEDGKLRDELQFNAAGKTHNFYLETHNGNTFTGNFDAIGSKQSINDGDRFKIRATVDAQAAGIKIGDKITEVKVAASNDGTDGDYMPGGYHGPVGTVEEPSEGSAPTHFVRKSLTLQGPIQYTSIDTDMESVTVDVDQQKLVSLTIENLLDKAQTITLTRTADAGVQAQFHDPAGPKDSGYTNSFQLDLNRGQSSIVHLAVTGQSSGATGEISVTVTTDLGGRITLPVTFGVETTAPEPKPTNTSGPEPTDNESPGLALVLLCGLLLAGAFVRRQ